MKEETTLLPNLPQLDWVQAIRDPIWDEIPITGVEKQIIQTEAFSRLRGIKQLSFAYLAFPGAVHSRFEHSLGVMQASNLLLKMVRRESNEQGIKIQSFARQLLRLAALLHDIGHPPFSHAMESLFTHYPQILRQNMAGLPPQFRDFLNSHGYTHQALGRHEVFSEYIICEDRELQEVLEEWILDEKQGEILPFQSKDFVRHTIQHVVAKLAIGESVQPAYLTGNLVPLNKIFKSIMSGDIDADKIDYLMRDNYYCGLAHGLDLFSLRNQLIPHEEGLIILPGAIGFVHSLILARYQLISVVHHDPWDVFATAKAVETLNRLLQKEAKPAERIVEIFTKWDDSKLIDYLLSSRDPTLKEILTTRYPLKEIARLDYLDTHPYIRECVQVLSEPLNHDQIPVMQAELRKATGNPDLYIHIQSIKSPEFSMQLAGGGSLLRDEILRGISEESIKHLHLIVYGVDGYRVDFRQLLEGHPDYVPCEVCERAQECVGNLSNEPLNKLLAELAVHRYRKISQERGDKEIISADFLLLIMDKVSQICQEKGILPPIRQALYRVAKLVYEELEGRIKIHGNLDLSEPEISSSFYQEIRKYEQMGLIAFSREIRKLPSEEGPLREVFRPDRRFEISDFGKLRLEKVRKLYHLVPEYTLTITVWQQVEAAIQHNEEKILQILSEQPI